MGKKSRTKSMDGQRKHQAGTFTRQERRGDENQPTQGKKRGAKKKEEPKSPAKIRKERYRKFSKAPSDPVAAYSAPPKHAYSPSNEVWDYGRQRWIVRDDSTARREEEARLLQSLATASGRGPRQKRGRGDKAPPHVQRLREARKTRKAVEEHRHAMSQVVSYTSRNFEVSSTHERTNNRSAIDERDLDAIQYLDNQRTMGRISKYTLMPSRNDPFRMTVSVTAKDTEIDSIMKVATKYVLSIKEQDLE
ncbi:MAG: hypothetical protein ABIE22_05265, partial [archaeon]